MQQMPTDATTARSTATSVLACTLLALSCLLIQPRRAAADQVDTLVRTLASDPDDKVRLSAAIGLRKANPRRALLPFVAALGDKSSSLRFFVAVSLPRMVDATTPLTSLTAVLSALERAAVEDPDIGARKQAAAAFAQLRPLRTTPDAAVVATAVAAPLARAAYVDLSSVRAGAQANEDLSPRLRTALQDGLTRHGARTSWEGGRMPDRLALQRAGLRGYYLEVSRILVEADPKDGAVTCSVVANLGRYPRDKIEILGAWSAEKSRSRVKAGLRPKDIRVARETCVAELGRHMADDAAAELARRR